MRKRKNVRPAAPQPSKAHYRLLDGLGGTSAVARLISEAIGHDIHPSAVSMWRRRGIPYRYRAILAQAANEKGVSVPAGFLGEVV